jgi:hypothetical protein
MTHPDPDSPADSEPLYEKRAVNPVREHFLPMHQRGTASFIFQTEREIHQVADRLGHPAEYVDQEGYEVEITAAAVDPHQDRLAWVHLRQKELGWSPFTGKTGHFLDISFHLRALVNGQLTLNWEICTYNPYFGCMVGYINWIGDHVVMIYREKHDTYAATGHIDGSVKYMKIEDRWTVQGTIVAYLGWRATEVQRLSLPGLELLPPLSKDEAIQMGLLAPDDDDDQT